MLISEFSRESGLSRDTIRFYVRRGLLAPELGGKGGANPYQVFTAQHVEIARVIRLAQSLGFSLKEIAGFAEEYRRGALTPARGAEIMRRQLVRLQEKAGQLDTMIRYVQAKIGWFEAGAHGPEPSFGDTAGCGCVDRAPPEPVRPAAAARRPAMAR